MRDDGDRIAIGAVTRHKDVSEAPLLRDCPIVSFTAGQVGDPQVRHRGTIGGSVSHSDPASDLPAVLFAVAEMVVRGPNGERVILPVRLLHRLCSRLRWAKARCSWRSACRSSAPRRAGPT